MGYIRHNAIIVTSDNYPTGKEKFVQVYDKAKKLFGELVSNIITSKINGYISFFIAPDGSKEDWEISYKHDTKREKLCNFIESLAEVDGSNAIKFVDVSYDEAYKANIQRTNKRVEE